MLISELARATNETPRTLRFYEAAGLLPETPRTAGNYRDYPAGAVDDVHFIRCLQGAGLTLSDIASIVYLRHNPQPLNSPDAALLAATIASIDTHVDTLRRSRQGLGTLTQQTQVERSAPRAGRARKHSSINTSQEDPTANSRLRTSSVIVSASIDRASRRTRANV